MKKLFSIFLSITLFLSLVNARALALTSADRDGYVVFDYENNMLNKGDIIRAGGYDWMILDPAQSNGKVDGYTFVLSQNYEMPFQKEEWGVNFYEGDSYTKSNLAGNLMDLANAEGDFKYDNAFSSLIESYDTELEMEMSGSLGSLFVGLTKDDDATDDTKVDGATLGSTEIENFNNVLFPLSRAEIREYLGTDSSNNNLSPNAIYYSSSDKTQGVKYYLRDFEYKSGDSYAYYVDENGNFSNYLMQDSEDNENLNLTMRPAGNLDLTGVYIKQIEDLGTNKVYELGYGPGTAIYHNNDGSEAASQIEEIESSEDFVYPTEHEDKEGYTFVGWYTNSDTSEINGKTYDFWEVYAKNLEEEYKSGTTIPTEYIKGNYTNDIDIKVTSKDGTVTTQMPSSPGEYTVAIGNDASFDIKITYYDIKWYDKLDGSNLNRTDTSLTELLSAPEASEVEGYVSLGWLSDGNDPLKANTLKTVVYATNNITKDYDGNPPEISNNYSDQSKVTYKYATKDSDEFTGDGLPVEAGEYKVQMTINDENYTAISDKYISVTINSEIENIPIYRLYNPNSGEHLFTAKINEYNNLPKSGWVQEGITFDAYSEDSHPDDAVAIYRIYNKNGLGGKGDHHYTKSYGEVEKRLAEGWTLDFGGKAAFYVSGSITTYKMYYAKNGAHHYTPKIGERDRMIKNGWTNEGTAWNVNAYYLKDGTRVEPS